MTIRRAVTQNIYQTSGSEYPREYFDPELSADGRTMYVSIDRGNGTDADIYVTTR